MKRKLPIILAAAVGLIALAAWFEPTSTVRGWVRQEPFFEGRSASWWRQKLLSQDPTEQAEYPRRLQAGGAEAAYVLGSLLGSSDVHVRLKAAEILEKQGPAAAVASAQLAGVLKDPDPHVRTVAAQALGKIGPKGLDPSAIPGLQQM